MSGHPDAVPLRNKVTVDADVLATFGRALLEGYPKDKPADGQRPYEVLSNLFFGLHAFYLDGKQSQDKLPAVVGLILDLLGPHLTDADLVFDRLIYSGLHQAYPLVLERFGAKVANPDNVIFHALPQGWFGIVEPFFAPRVKRTGDKMVVACGHRYLTLETYHAFKKRWGEAVVDVDAVFAAAVDAVRWAVGGDSEIFETLVADYGDRACNPAAVKKEFGAMREDQKPEWLPPLLGKLYPGVEWRVKQPEPA